MRFSFINHLPISRRSTALTAAALSLLPIGQPLILGTVGITTATTAVLFQQSPANAKDALAVAKIAKAITVRIEGATQGSGVLVKKEGNRYTVLTAWHVVSGNRPGEEVAIIAPDGKEHQLENGSIERLGEVDMAVLTFSSPGAYEVASIGDIKKVKHDQPIYVAGFPLNNSQNLRYEKGEVVANADVGIDQGYQLLYDNKTESGMSGGVLLNADGELVGLHGRGEKNEKESTVREMTMKTGINQGVPITYYNLFSSGDPVVIAKTTASTAGDYLAQAKASQSKRGREQTVIKLTTQALRLRSSIKGYFLRAYAKHDIKDYQGAIADYSKAIEINPQDVLAYNNRGNSRQKSNDYQGAFDDHNKAIAINPKFAPGYLNRGNTKQELKDFLGAITDYNKAIEINAQYVLAYSNRGNAKTELGDHQGGIADFNKAIEINPQFADAYSNRGISKSDLGDKQGAISDYNKAIGIDPQHPVAYSNRGIAKRHLGDAQGAIVDYNKAITINAQDAPAYNNRGYAKHTLKDYQGAILDYNKAIKINPKFATAYNNRGWSKYLQGDFKNALEDANKALAITPNYGAALDTRGLAKHALGQDRSACKDLKRASFLGYQGASQYLQSEDGIWCSNMRQGNKQ